MLKIMTSEEKGLMMDVYILGCRMLKSSTKNDRAKYKIVRDLFPNMLYIPTDEDKEFFKKDFEKVEMFVKCYQEEWDRENKIQEEQDKKGKMKKMK